MSQEFSEKMLNGLLGAKTAEEVHSILGTYESSIKWVSIGDDDNNAGRVEGQMKIAENAFVEKITNSIDAILMKICRERGIDPSDKSKAPKSLQDAISQFIGGEKKFTKLRKQRTDIIILAEGRKDCPTLTVIDRGEGQEPEQLTHTILGLSKRLKADINFVYGKYHQGGSAALRFSGSKPTDCYQLVLTKRASSLNPVNKDWALSLVRKIYMGRVALYQYCTDQQGNILTLPHNFVAPFTKEHNIDFPDGTLIKIYDYQLTKTTSIVYGRNSLAEEINKKLLQPAVPIFLRELRPDYTEGKKLGSTQYTIGGLLRIIKDNPDIIKEEFSVPADLGPLGNKKIKFLILKHVSVDPSVSTYKERPEKIYYLENGLSLNTQQVGFISDICQLPDLADYVLCFIDISDVSPEQTNLFHSSREEFANTHDYKALKDKLKIVFEDPKFTELQREYKNLNIANAQLLDLDTNKMLEQVLKDDEELIRDLDLGDDLNLETDAEEPREPERVEPYHGKFLPTKFQLLGSPEREVQESNYLLMSFQTDAVDDFLDRPNDQGVCDPPTTQLFSISRRTPRNGVITFRIQTKQNIVAEQEEELEFTLEVPSRHFVKSCKVKVKVLPKHVYIGKEYPTYFTPAKSVFKIARQEVRQLNLKTDAPNDLFLTEKGFITLASSDLEVLKYVLRDGTLSIDFECISTEIGKKEPIHFDVSCKNGAVFNLKIPLEVIPEQGPKQFKKPEILPIGKDAWAGRGWDSEGLDIAEVVRDNDGLTVYYNSESRAWDQVKSRIRTDDIKKAEQKYISDCYIQALHLYFEFKGDNEYKTYIRRSMKAIGRSMPAMISKLFRS
jgi:hypothetical protein